MSFPRIIAVSLVGGFLLVCAAMILSPSCSSRDSAGNAMPTVPAGTNGQAGGQTDTRGTTAQPSKPLGITRPADAPMPPMGETDLITLIEAYSTNELHLLGAIQKATKAVPSERFQPLIRMVRRRETDEAITAYIRDEIPGISAKTIAYEWAMGELHGTASRGESPLLKGGGPTLIQPIPSEGTRAGGKPINP